MRPKLIVAALVGAFLLLAGIQPAALPYSGGDARFSDAVLTHWPNALFLRRSILETQTFPVWRDTIMAGQPFAANPLNKTAYPFQWLALLLPPTLHLNVLILIHFLIAGAGMWSWTRALDLRPEAAALSTLAYLLAPRLIAHLGAGHLDLFYALAWWPWLIWSIRQLIRQPQHLAVNCLQTALFAALIFLADTRLSLFALSTAAVSEIITLAQNRSKSRQIRWRLLVVPLFLLLTLSILLPLRSWQPYLNRADLTLAEAGVFALDWGHLAGLILPAHTGNFETLTYLGLPVLSLMIVGVVSERRRAWPWLAVIILAGLYALGSNTFLWPLAVKTVPALLWFRVPSRAWLIITLLAPLLAGYGLQQVLAWAESPHTNLLIRRARLAAAGGLVASLACGGFVLLALKSLSASVGLSILIIGVTLSGLLLGILTCRVKSRWIGLLFFGLTFLDLAWIGYHWLQWRGPETWLDPYRPLAQRLVEAGADRIYSPTYSLEQQVAEAYNLRLFGGVDPFQLRGIVRGIELGSGVPIETYSVVIPPLLGIASDADIAWANRQFTPNTNVLGQWHVSHIVAAYPIEQPRLQWLDTVNGVYIYANRDYNLSSQSKSAPDWPDSGPDLPDSATIKQLNQMTLTTAFISGVSFVICAALILFLRLKTHVSPLVSATAPDPAGDHPAHRVSPPAVR